MKKRGKENRTMRRAAEAVVEAAEAEAVVEAVVEVTEAEAACECENEFNRRCRRRYYTVFFQVCVYNCNNVHDYRVQNHHHRIHYRKIRIIFLF